MSRRIQPKRPRRSVWGLFIILLVSPVVLAPQADSMTAEPQAIGRPDSTGSSIIASLLARPLIASISLYQTIISPQQGEVCAFQPTCSHFAQQALRTHGLFQGGLMMSDRLQRCHACASGHYRTTGMGLAYDPVGDHILWGWEPGCRIDLQEIDPPFSPLPSASNEAFAEYLAMEGDYSRAYSEFTRFAELHPGQLLALRAKLSAGICLQKTGKWEAARKLFGELMTRGVEDATGAEATYQSAVSLLLAGRPDQAEKISAPLLETPLRDRVVLLDGWSALRCGRWRLAVDRLDGVDPASSGKLSEMVSRMKSRALKGPLLPYRRPWLAALFSSLLPGTGKMYAGRPADGIYSLLLTGSSALVTISYGRNEKWTRAGLFGTMGLFFYLGNIYGSAVEARRYNQAQRERLLEGLPEDVDIEGWLWDLPSGSDPVADSTAQTPSADLAEMMFRQGRFEEAISEYRRLLFHCPDDSLESSLRYRIGLVYLNEKQWNRARQELQRAAGTTSSQQLNHRARLRLGQSYLSEGFPERGEDLLRDLLRQTRRGGNVGLSAEAQFWLGVSTLHQGRWTEAAGWFQDLSRRLSNSDLPSGARQLETAAWQLETAARQLETAARQGYGLPRRSPALATTLSVILPGSGQIYGGRIWSGLLSLALNAAAGYLTIDAFQEDRHLDGALLATLVWSRFYFGGLHNAGRYAREFNRKKTQEHLAPYRSLMQPDYSN
jgi:putative membrane protein insertion efficiency factor